MSKSLLSLVSVVVRSNFYIVHHILQDDSDRGRQNSARRPQPGVVTEVESFYNRPKTVIDGVEQFYVESLESDAQQGQSPKTEVNYKPICLEKRNVNVELRYRSNI